MTRQRNELRAKFYQIRGRILNFGPKKDLPEIILDSDTAKKIAEIKNSSTYFLPVIRLNHFWFDLKSKPETFL